MRSVVNVQVSPLVPEKIGYLKELAYNLWWTWNHNAIDLFRRIDEDLWAETNHNPVAMLGRVPQDHLEDLAADDGFVNHLEAVTQEFKEYLQAETWFAREHGKAEEVRFAYFSMEFGLTESLRIYSGGLGILAGDHLKSASDLGLPLAGVSLLYQRGYLQQYLNADGWQQEVFPVNDVYNLPVLPVLKEDGAPLLLDLQMADRGIHVKVWKTNVGRVVLYLLDTNLQENPPEYRGITGQLYGGNIETRIQQEIVLGIGGYRALYAMGLRPQVCHMNEGHSAFLALERLRCIMKESNLDFGQARVTGSGGNIFTTHTAVPAGFDLFSRELMEKYFSIYVRELGIDMEKLIRLGRQNPGDAGQPFNMAIFAMRNTSYINAVSALHGEVSRKMTASGFPEIPPDEIPISAITNGIHMESWISNDMEELLTRYIGPQWKENMTDPAVWKAVDRIPDTELWRTHERRRERLVAFSRRRLHRQLAARMAPKEEIQKAYEVLEAGALTIGFARRFATYKRATLILRDKERLTKILTDPKRPVQIIFAGKAHPADDQAKAIIKEIVHFARQPGIRERVVFLENYDMSMSRYLVSGVDLWLNTPRRPAEASGTSGMKALPNGALNCSILDGWWPEAYTPEVGWTIGAGEEYEDAEYQNHVESNAIYDLLEKEIIPIFYDRSRDGLPRRWIRMMKNSMKALCPVYNTDRMVQQYTHRFYLPATDYYKSLADDGFRGGREYTDWRRKVRDHWNEIRIERVEADGKSTHYTGESISVRAVAALGSLAPGDVRVEIYAGLLDENHKFKIGVTSKMALSTDLGGGRFLYEGSCACQEVGLHGIGVRVVPSHKSIVAPHALPLIKWA